MPAAECRTVNRHPIDMTPATDHESVSLVDLASVRKARVPLEEINASFLQLLVDMARNTVRPTGDFIAPLRAALCDLPEPVTAIAARTPVLLLDLQFADATWWNAVATDASRVPPAARWLTSFPKARALKLARATLTLAWHLSRTDTAAEMILMGLTAPVSAIVGTLRFNQLDAIAERQFTHLRPRWEDRPRLWLQLLSGNLDPLNASAFTLRALQLSWSPTRTPL